MVAVKRRERKVRKVFLHIALVSLLGGSFYSCKTTQKLEEGTRLYTGGKLNIKDAENIKYKKELLEGLEEVNKPRPNEKIGGLRLGLWAHQKVEDEEAGFYAKWVNKRIGEDAVLLDKVNTNNVQKLMKNRMENLGYFNSKVQYEIKKNKKTGFIKYEIAPGNRLMIDSISFQRVGNKKVDSLIQNYLELEQPIKKGTPFSLEELKSTRTEISEFLKKEGYYYFTSNNLIFEADTLNSERENTANLKLSIKDNASELALVPYVIDNINVFPKYSLDTSGDPKSSDTTNLKGVNFIQSEEFFRPDRLYPYLFIKEGDYYNPQKEKWTNKRLNSLKTYRFVNIRYREDSVLTDGKGQLTANVFLSPLSKRSFRAELQAVSKSNNFVGPSLNFEYLNRNLFKGGEALRLSSKIGYEAQLNSGDVSTNLSTIETGVSAELIVPRMIFPLPLGQKFRYSIPKTKFKLSYELLNRSQWFNLNSFLAVYGFEWNPNIFVTHNLNPVSINYINIGNESEAFINLKNSNPFLARSFEQQFIPGLNYSFQWSQLVRNIKSNRFYFSFNADFAGNALALAQNIGGVTGDDKKFWGQSYAQFSRFDFDLRNYQELGDDSRLVSRIFAGIGLPYGNSVSLPYSKQYFSGGPNSVRAFRIRRLGPGNYQPEDQTDGTSFFDQAGDIKIEANIEYRFPLISYLRGAVFTDAGNVWLKNEDNRNGQFTSNWINEVAIGSGIGLRLDIEFFVIRLDVATPIRKPGANSFQWQDSFELGDKSWREENITWNFGIGYPF
ncbi:Outer membrane protein assembly factor BamA [Marivirga sericea]|uniref:Outer membrane protein assembly factor BamA n=1 Tax=Marivirga sericea TaxID=1028 RepID=A0A1X7LEK5_9BACT|nr:BamA/TamA family outer membrane protein [Marivirga sericea]SMG51609.1 Outer membrane protein assembly factor BamA [Marivirga sericea]